MDHIDKIIQENLEEIRSDLESKLNADILAYFGIIASAYHRWFQQRLELLVKNRKYPERLVVVLDTAGGEVEAVERMVNMLRHFYNEIYFFVPDMAMSAGTIFCMSGDKIFMDYTSSLGPIDPQVQTRDGSWVPALGYLDKFNEIVQKSAEGNLTSVEYAIAQNQDLAELRRYEQARDLSVSLLKDWLTKFKFKDWKFHRTHPHKKGLEVTLEEKKLRAEEIAHKLGDNKIWHSHGRRIGIYKLRTELRLEIDDYSDNQEIRELINKYYDCIKDVMARKNFNIFVDVSQNTKGG